MRRFAALLGLSRVPSACHRNDVRSIAMLLIALASGCLTDGRCPCGQTFETNPFDPYGGPIGVNHPRGIHCICRCAGGEPVLEDPALDCSIYEGPCRGPEGEPAEYRCD